MWDGLGVLGSIKEAGDENFAGFTVKMGRHALPQFLKQRHHLIPTKTYGNKAIE